MFSNRGLIQEAIYHDKLIPVNPNLTYRLSVDAMAHPKIKDSNSFIGIVEFDQDKNPITAIHHMYIPGTTTTLAKVPDPDDEVIYLKDSKSWISSEKNYQRRFIFWNYQTKDETKFDPHTYSRNLSSLNAWDTGTTPNYTEHTIKLNKKWKEICPFSITLDTPVSQANDGGTFKYCVIVNQDLSKNWHTYEGKIGGIDTSGENHFDKFCTATRYVQFLVLTGYHNTPGERVWFHNVRFEEVK